MKRGYSKLEPVNFGIAGGILYSIFVLLISVIPAAFPTWEKLLYECYGVLGYNPFTLGGFILGIIYGFVDGFVSLYLIAWIYNLLE